MCSFTIIVTYHFSGTMLFFVFHGVCALVRLSVQSCCFFCQCGVSCVLMTICGLFSSVGCFTFVSNEVVEVRGNSCVGGFFGRFGQDVFFSG